MAVPADSDLNNISLEYSYEELQQATQNFDMRFQLGTGSFGSVYRGLQRDGTEVAVKVLDLPDEAGFEEEVRVLSKFRHPNLVILMGFGRRDTQRFLVYELLGGGDVYQRLQQSCLDKKSFSWRQRLSSAFDAACGLSHLHNATPKVFHRDIKSPNILLDRNGTGKMADFGLACLSHSSSQKVEKASGTVGYACPLYAQRQVVTEGSEVYSFGIVLLELLTASPPCYVQNLADGTEQYQFLVTHINNSTRIAVSMADPKAGWSQQRAGVMADMALRCTQMPEEARPCFTSIVNTLRSYRDEADDEPPPLPLQRPALQPALQPHAVQPGQAGLAIQPIIVGATGPCGAASNPAAPGHVQQGGMVHLNAAVAFGGGGHPASSALGRPLGQGIPRPGVPGGPGQSPALLAVGSPSHGANQQIQLTGAAGGPVANLISEQASAMRQGGAVVTAIRQIGSAQPPPHVMGPPAVRVTMPPLLWTLTCVHADVGCQLSDMSMHQRAIVHHQEPGGPLPTTLRVGRLFQGEFFDTMVQDAKVRGAVSREHFQIWADQDPACSGGAEVPCLFFLTNYSANGTLVNGKHLGSRGDLAALHQGDIIAMVRACDGVLTPFLEFMFDLTGSCLRDADVDAHVAAVRQVPAPGGGGSHSTAARGSTMPVSGGSAALAPGGYVEGGGAQAAPPLILQQMPDRAAVTSRLPDGSLAASFLPAEVSPIFMLEAGGSAVREGLLLEHKRIAHGPLLGTHGVDNCPPLLLGRALQSDFWTWLLLDRAYNALSRHHMQIEVMRNDPTPSDDGACEFYVRNLSDRNPIRVCSSLGCDVYDEAMMEAAPPMEKDEERVLRHGDIIVMNPNRGTTLWLTFKDLYNRRQLQAPQQLIAPVALSSLACGGALTGRGRLSTKQAPGGMSTDASKGQLPAPTPTIRLAAPGSVVSRLRSDTPERCPNDTR